MTRFIENKGGETFYFSIITRLVGVSCELIIKVFMLSNIKSIIEYQININTKRIYKSDQVSQERK